MNMISPLAGSSLWHADIETGKVRRGSRTASLTCSCPGAGGADVVASRVPWALFFSQPAAPPCSPPPPPH